MGDEGESVVGICKVRNDVGTAVETSSAAHSSVADGRSFEEQTECDIPFLPDRSLSLVLAVSHIRSFTSASSTHVNGLLMIPVRYLGTPSPLPTTSGSPSMSPSLPPSKSPSVSLDASRTRNSFAADGRVYSGGRSRTTWDQQSWFSVRENTRESGKGIVGHTMETGPSLHDESRDQHLLLVVTTDC